ncbi:Phosphoglucomutase-1 [Blattella germanica]|nr:Phosphoglucomutase-1 [Blattella germanica]
MNYSSSMCYTNPYSCQNPGTAGLRKKVEVFKQNKYTENFIQAIISSLNEEELANCTLIVGGDGRYFTNEAIKLIIEIAAGNGIGKLVIGKNGLLSTPAASNLIRQHNAIGGIILTAFYRRAGPFGHFGIKFNDRNGCPASEERSKKLSEASKNIRSVIKVRSMECNINSDPRQYTFIVDNREFKVNIINPECDYVRLMKDIFDFQVIKNFLEGKEFRQPFNIIIDSRNGVTGPYVEQIFGKELGVHSSCIFRTIPLSDFSGLHPDPNASYSTELVGELVKKGNYDFGAALDTDGSRSMILGRDGVYVTPGDSLAIIAANFHHIPYFRITGLKGIARSTLTSAAVDKVANYLDSKFYEVPIGWEFFPLLLEGNMYSLCGEETMGIGPDNIRERDGIWTVLAWLQIMASRKMELQDLVMAHWEKFGRNVFARFDYVSCDIQQSELVFQHIEEVIRSEGFVGKELSSNGKSYTVKEAGHFEYFDPVDGKSTPTQGIKVIFGDGSRILYGRSDTSSQAETIKIYVDAYEAERVNEYPKVIMEPLVSIAHGIAEIDNFTGLNQS